MGTTGKVMYFYNWVWSLSTKPPSTFQSLPCATETQMAGVPAYTGSQAKGCQFCTSTRLKAGETCRTSYDYNNHCTTPDQNAYCEDQHGNNQVLFCEKAKCSTYICP